MKNKKNPQKQKKQTKQKSLKPTLREKKRYLLLEIATDSESVAKKLVKQTILDFTGILGYAKACPRIIKIWKQEAKAKQKKMQMILSVNRKELDKIKAGFAVSKAKISVKRVSGTLKKLRS